MSAGPELRTERLLLRRWRDQDRDPFAALNTHPAVVEFLAGPLSRSESDALIERIEQAFDERGYGWWAVEVPGEAPFVGFVGLAPVAFEAGFTPAVEIGWRLDPQWWGRGLATEAARAALAYAFDVVELDEVVSFTAVANIRSRRVMERLGMTRDPADDFAHPGLPVDHALVEHVLYRVRRPGAD